MTDTALRFVARDQISRIARGELQQLMREMLTPALGLIVAELRRENDVKFDALQAAVGEFGFKGAWIEGRTYRPGNFVSLGGSIFHANVVTDSRPGTDSTWTLAVKSGRDGRDGRDAPSAPVEPPERRTTKSSR